MALAESRGRTVRRVAEGAKRIVGRGVLAKKQKYVDPLEQLSPAVVNVLKQKVYLLYGQTHSRIGLLSNYKVAVFDKPTMLEHENPNNEAHEAKHLQSNLAND